MDKIHYINNNVENLFGYKRSELIETSINGLIPPNFWNNHTNLMKRII